MRAWRLPMILLLIAGLIAAIAVERDDDESEVVEATPSVAAVPTAARPGSLGSTWFCAAGTATGEQSGEAEHVVHMANGSDAPVQGRLTLYPSEGERTTTTVEVPAMARVDLRVSDVVRAPFAAVLAEFDGGEIAVQHELSGPSGRSTSACASAPASTWFFPQATTRAGSRLLLTLFNPFPTEAVVDVNLEAEDGARTPQAFQGLVVPGGQVTTLVVSDVVTLRQELATAVNVRSGRVIAEQVQIIGNDAEGFPPSVTAMLGAPAPEPVWMFPDGIGADAYQERVVLYNPSEAAAEVDVEVLLDDPETNGVAEPFEITVQPRRYSIIDVFGDGRVPTGVAHAIVVRSQNDVPVVAQRIIVGAEEAAQRGVGYTLGLPVVAGRWLAPTASLDGTSGSAVIVFNPSPTDDVVFSARLLGGGRSEAIEGLDGATLPPLGRLVIDIGDGVGLELPAVVIETDGLLVAESRFGFERGDDLSYLMAVPVAGTVESPEGVVGELSEQTVILGGD